MARSLLQSQEGSGHIIIEVQSEKELIDALLLTSIRWNGAGIHLILVCNGFPVNRFLVTAHCPSETIFYLCCYREYDGVTPYFGGEAEKKAKVDESVAVIEAAVKETLKPGLTKVTPELTERLVSTIQGLLSPETHEVFVTSTHAETVDGRIYVTISPKPN